MGRISSEPCRILVFNPLKRLIGIFQSSTAAAKAFNTRSQSIHYACTGRCISCQNMYFRHLQDNIEVTFDDLGVLRLEEYDDLCGVDRKVYRTKKMDRTGMKYNKQPKKVRNNESFNYKQIKA